MYIPPPVIRVTMAPAFRLPMRPAASENMSQFTVDFSTERAELRQLRFLPGVWDHRRAGSYVGGVTGNGIICGRGHRRAGSSEGGFTLGLGYRTVGHR